MTVTRPRAERGAFPPGTEHYGRSLLGAPLIWFPAPAASRESGLILAGTHGDENSSVVTLSCALRTLTPSLRRHHVVLCVNPDGCQLGLRANANGVDLNRNFPAANLAPNLKPRRCASLYTAFNLPGWSHSTIHWPVLKIPDTAN